MNIVPTISVDTLIAEAAAIVTIGTFPLLAVMIPLNSVAYASYRLSNRFIRYLLAAEPEISVLNFDCLPYAGNPANLDITYEEQASYNASDLASRERRRPGEPGA